MLFDAFYVVDWSARSKPSSVKPSADAIWIGEVGAEHYFRTRFAAEAWLTARLEAHVVQNERVFVGCDFGFGYPAGFWSWENIWEFLVDRIEDSEMNENNRFEVARELNQKLGAGNGPFWGCPKSQEGGGLMGRQDGFGFPYRVGDVALKNFRLTEKRGLGRIQPMWKLMGIGSVGSQSLLGILMLQRLRRRFGQVCQVWPMETGFGVVSADIILAEIWPSMMTVDEGDIKDQMQVRAFINWLSGEQEIGRLGDWFLEPEGLFESDILRIVQEEGWIFGVR